MAVAVPSPPRADDIPAARARAAAALGVLAVAGHRIGGIVLRDSSAGAQQWIAALRLRLPQQMKVVRLPSSATDDRIFGGLDLAATIATGRPVAERGVIAEAHGGVVIIPLIERMPVATQARLGAVLDTGVAQVLRDGVRAEFDAQFTLIAIDESDEDAWGVAAPLRDRLALVLDGDVRVDEAMLPDASTIAAARDRITRVGASDEVMVGLGTLCAAFGIASERAARMALWTARALAALDERDDVDEADVALAAQLVLAPRATRMPPAPDADDAPAAEPPPSPDAANPPPPADAAQPDTAPEPPPPSPPESRDDQPMDERLVDAVTAAIPPELLAELLSRAQRPSQEMGRAGAEKESWTRGRQVAARRGTPDGVRRLHVLETLRAAAPWQRARAAAARDGAVRSLIVQRDDFRIRRYVERAGTSVIFVVDASGSAAAQRLGEAKGAVEALLAESYARRDRVSLIAFRGTTAEVLLPPTRALARARKLLASLPGGGGTPLATAIDSALTAAVASRRAGTLPVVVFLTDGRANVARDGRGGRAESMRDALDAATTFNRSGLSSVLIDTSPRPEPMARRIAEAMGARYVPLPVADARAIAGAVALAKEIG